MFVLKNEDSKYFGHYTISTTKNKTGRWVESLDIEFYDIPIFTTTEEAEEYINEEGSVELFSKDIAINIADKIGIDEVYYELLPQDKYKLLEESLNKKKGLIGA